MPRTINLGNDELTLLRREIQATFIKSNGHHRNFNPNSYSESYLPLLAQMQSDVPAYADEFSVRRLVKLFHSTDPLTMKVE